MPATTRSGAKQKQAHIDDVTETKSGVASSKRKAASTEDVPRKRTAQPKHVQDPNSKGSPAKDNAKGEGKESESSESKDDILINRAPVLELWAATVTSFLYPQVSWKTSLSAGSAISTLCAISKGRAIGTIDKPDSSTEGKKRQRPKSDELEELDVMGFNLKMKNEEALVGGNPKKANEQVLIRKFGEDAYKRTKESFQDALRSWSGQEEELNSQAFHCYEVFRPTVPKGQKGWGRKGILNLQTAKEAIGPC